MEGWGKAAEFEILKEGLNTSKLSRAPNWCPLNLCLVLRMLSLLCIEKGTEHGRGESVDFSGFNGIQILFILICSLGRAAPPRCRSFSIIV